MSGAELGPVYAALAEQFAARFAERVGQPRTVGREAEYPLVTETGEAGDLRRLWELLLQGGDLEPLMGPGPVGQGEMIVGLRGKEYRYEIEVGVGTVEINTRPCATLFEVEEIGEAAVSRLARAAARRGWRVLGYGIQPRTGPALRIMAPKQRYQSLYRAMGAEWLWYTVTASDQVQVAVGRDEMVRMLNFGSAIAPALIALCANSPVYGGRLSPFCSGREGHMAQIYAQEHRHGMLARPMRDMADFVESVSQATYLIVKSGGEIAPSSEPFAEYLRREGADFEAFLFHEHYMWNSARLRAAYGTLELRPACQQPWGEQLAAAALGLGLVEAAEAAQAYMEGTLGEGYWDALQEYHRQAIRYGLAAAQPAPGFLRRLVELAEEGLAGRGQGEERFLAPIHRRMERRMNPAQRARAVFQSDGLAGLVAHTTVRPAPVGTAAAGGRTATRLAGS